MKPVFKCEYCDKLGTEEDIAKHENECIYNYARRSCLTCRYAENKITKFVCEKGHDIPEGHMFENCKSYDCLVIDGIAKTADAFSSLFGDIFR